MATIDHIQAREIINSRGLPALEVEIALANGITQRVSVPQGSSSGSHEAKPLFDHDPARYGGKGLRGAIINVEKVIAPQLRGKSVLDQRELDVFLKSMDGTPQLERIGANAILGVSMAACRAAAASQNVPLYRHIARISGNEHEKMRLPIPILNVLNGGAHAANGLAFQEFWIIPNGAPNFREAMRMSCEVYHSLAEVLAPKMPNPHRVVKKSNIVLPVGDEGGYAPPLTNVEEALDAVHSAVEKSGYASQVQQGVDCAASELLCSSESEEVRYKLQEDRSITAEELSKEYHRLIEKFHLAAIEDPFAEDDWENWRSFSGQIKSKELLVIGDDLLVTNPSRIKRAVQEHSANGLLLKLNQIGTISDAIEAWQMARAAGWSVCVSHRSGDTEDDFIADFAVGIGANYMKSGAPCRSERCAKYNRLMRIEEELGSDAYFGNERLESH